MEVAGACPRMALRVHPGEQVAVDPEEGLPQSSAVMDGGDPHWADLHHRVIAGAWDAPYRHEQVGAKGSILALPRQLTKVRDRWTAGSHPREDGSPLQRLCRIIEPRAEADIAHVEGPKTGDLADLDQQALRQ